MLQSTNYGLVSINDRQVKAKYMHLLVFVKLPILEYIVRL